jgi:RNA polymerase sigma-70 factor, ECF subfamily
MNLTLPLDRDEPAGEPVDRALVEAARSDPQAFAAIYDRYGARVYRYLYYRVHNVQDAQDLTSQVFFDAYRGLPGYRPGLPFGAWLFTIARRRVADHYRRQKPETNMEIDESLPAVADDPLTQAIHAEKLDRLAQVVSRLPDEELELLRLRFSAELSFSEMAALLGRREEAVKKSVYRLLARLEIRLEAERDA